MATESTKRIKDNSISLIDIELDQSESNTNHYSPSNISDRSSPKEYYSSRRSQSSHNYETSTNSTTSEYIPDGSRSRISPSPGRRIVCPKTGITYELGEQIGSGAAAIVFKCRRVLVTEGQERLDDLNEIAAKVMDLRGLKLRTDFQREREKLRREVSILSRLHHPCIVNLLHVIETKEELFLMMELVKGGELFYKIVDRGSLSEDQARYVLLQVLSALDYMHEKGVIHRDLKPENILVASEPSPGFFTVKVADLGLAKLVTHGISEAKSFVGTPQYWAPEVIDASTTANHVYGPEADLWSLGCVIYVMLGGSYPFDTRREPIETLIKNAKFHFRYPRFVGVSDEAKDLIRGLLTVDPKKRLTVKDVLAHPWMKCYKPIHGIPPLPILSPLESKNFEHSLKIATNSILGPTSSFNLNSMVPSSATPLTVDRKIGFPCDNDLPAINKVIKTNHKKKEKKKVDDMQHGKVDVVYPDDDHHGQHQHGGRFSIDSRIVDPISILTQEGTRAAVYRSDYNRDRPDDPNTRAIVPAYALWRPPQYFPPPQYPGPPQSEMPFVYNQGCGFVSPPQGGYWWYPPPQYVIPPNYYNPVPNPQQMISQRWPQTHQQYGRWQQESELQQQAAPTYQHWQQGEGNAESSSCPTYFYNDNDEPQSEPDENLSGKNYRFESPSTGGPTTQSQRDKTVRSPEVIFNFDELLDLQIYIIRKFHWAYIALRRCPNTAKLLRDSIRKVQNIHNESVHVVKQFEMTCSSVLRVLPDLMMAVKERQPQLAIDLFEDVRVWMNDLKLIVQDHQDHIGAFIENTEQLIEGIRHTKIATDETFLRAAANLSAICDGERSGSADSRNCPRIHSLDSIHSSSGIHSCHVERSGRKPSITNVENFTGTERAGHKLDLSQNGPGDDCINMILRRSNFHNPTENVQVDLFSNNCGKRSINLNGFDEWYDNIRHSVLDQLESLLGKAVKEMKPDVCPDRESCDQTEITCIANDLLDLMFLWPRSSVEHQAILGNRRCLEVDPQQQRHSRSYCCETRRHHPSKPMVLPCQSKLVRDEFPRRTRSHSNPDSTRTGSSDDNNYGVSISTPSLKHQLATTVPPTEGGSSNDFHQQSLKRHRGRKPNETRRRRWRAQRHLYGHALKTSEILVRALDEVRRVDQILRQSAEFWINFVIIIDQLCKMKTHTERLLQYSISNPQFAKRFFERLDDYRQFWTALRDHSKHYVLEAQSKMRALNEFALAIESTADRADTVNALHLGQSAAILGCDQSS